MNLNKVIIQGRLGDNPKEFNGGCRFTVATNQVFKNKDGNDTETVEWHSVIVFGKYADNCKKFLVRGQEVLVEGRLQTRTYEEEGDKKYRTDIIANNVQFGQRPKNKNQQDELELGF